VFQGLDVVDYVIQIPILVLRKIVILFIKILVVDHGFVVILNIHLIGVELADNGPIIVGLMEYGTQALEFVAQTNGILVVLVVLMGIVTNMMVVLGQN
jgi:hypothetical protein